MHKLPQTLTARGTNKAFQSKRGKTKPPNYMQPTNWLTHRPMYLPTSQTPSTQPTHPTSQPKQATNQRNQRPPKPKPTTRSHRSPKPPPVGFSPWSFPVGFRTVKRHGQPPKLHLKATRRDGSVLESLFRSTIFAWTLKCFFLQNVEDLLKQRSSKHSCLV